MLTNSLSCILFINGSRAVQNTRHEQVRAALQQLQCSYIFVRIGSDELTLTARAPASLQYGAQLYCASVGLAILHWTCITHGILCYPFLENYRNPTSQDLPKIFFSKAKLRRGSGEAPARLRRSSGQANYGEAPPRLRARTLHATIFL